MKDGLVKEIAQLDLTITNLQDKLTYLNKVAEVLLNLDNSDPESRRLARYDYAKMNLTSVIKMEQIEQEIEVAQNELSKFIYDYKYLARRLENFVKILNDLESNKDNKKINESKIL